MPGNHFLLDLNNLATKKDPINLAKEISANLRLINERHGNKKDHRLHDQLELNSLLKDSSDEIKEAWQSLLAKRYLAFAHLEKNKDKSDYKTYKAQRETFLSKIKLPDNVKQNFEFRLKLADKVLVKHCKTQSLEELDGGFLQRLLNLGSNIEKVIKNAFAIAAPVQQSSFEKMAQLGLENPALNQNSKHEVQFGMQIPSAPPAPSVLPAPSAPFVQNEPDISGDEALARRLQQEWQDESYAERLEILQREEMENRISANKIQIVEQEAFLLAQEKLAYSDETIDDEKIVQILQSDEYEDFLAQERFEMSPDSELAQNESMCSVFGMFAMAVSYELSFSFIAMRDYSKEMAATVIQMPVMEAVSMSLLSITFCQQTMFATPRPNRYNNRSTQPSLFEQEDNRPNHLVL